MAFNALHSFLGNWEFYSNLMLGTLDLTGSDHWAPFNFFLEHGLDDVYR